MKNALAAVAVILLSSCGITSGFLRDSHSMNQIDIRMDAQNVQFMRQARGSHTVGMLFCSIPFGDAHYASAMEELAVEAHLGPNEILMNYREDTQFLTYVAVWCSQKVTISADVVKITPRGEPLDQIPAPRR